MGGVGDGSETLRTRSETQKRGLSQRYKYGSCWHGRWDLKPLGGASDSSLPLPFVGTGGQTISYVLRRGKEKQSIMV